MARRQTAASMEACRMTWYLVQVPHSHNVNGALQKCFKYFIIHSVDINDTESSSMYVDRIVSFNQRHDVFRGKILMASEERPVIEAELKKVLSAEKRKQANEKFLILQYSSGFKNVSYMFAAESDVVWPTFLPPDIREVIIDSVLDQQHRATVLTMDDKEEELERKYNELKEYSLKKCLEHKQCIGDGQWIWVQYSGSPYTVTYAILNKRDIVWGEPNLFKDVVAYFKIGQNVYQGIVLQRAEDIKVLLIKMSAMKESCLQFLMTAENKANASTGATAVAATAGATNNNNAVAATSITAAANVNLAIARALPGAPFMGNRVTFYGSHLNTNNLG